MTAPYKKKPIEFAVPWAINAASACIFLCISIYTATSHALERVVLEGWQDFKFLETKASIEENLKKMGVVTTSDYPKYKDSIFSLNITEDFSAAFVFNDDKLVYIELTHYRDDGTGNYEAGHCQSFYEETVGLITYKYGYQSFGPKTEEKDFMVKRVIQWFFSDGGFIEVKMSDLFKYGPKHCLIYVNYSHSSIVKKEQNPF